MTGSTTLPRIRRLRSDAERWSFAAFALALVGLALSTVVILGSDGDPSDVRWWLVVAPVLVTALPVVAARHGVRLAAAIVLGGWCFLTGFSIGMLLVPALIASVAAVTRDAP